MAKSTKRNATGGQIDRHGGWDIEHNSQPDTAAYVARVDSFVLSTRALLLEVVAVLDSAAMHDGAPVVETLAQAARRLCVEHIRHCDAVCVASAAFGDRAAACVSADGGSE